MFFSHRHAVAACASVLALCAVPASAAAQNYPSKPITLVVPFPAGGQTDAVARILAERLTHELGQPVIVNNRPGVNGSLGSDYVARATPDGYTLVATGPGTHAINQLVNSNVNYDARTDFTHVALPVKTSNVLLASPRFQGESLDDVVSISKENPGSLAFALTGIGSSGHMSMELLKQAAGIEFTAVPYKGDAPAINDMLGGQVDLLFVNSVAAAPQARAGKLRAFAVTGRERNALLPDVPTMGELGIPEVVVESWVGISGPANLPPEIVARLNEAVNQAASMPEVQERFAATGLVTSSTTPQEASDFVNSEVEKWSKVVEAGNIRVE